MDLAVTAPHGAAAWIGWAFGIAAPIASVLVAGVALYLSTATTRRERAEERIRASGEAALVSVALFDKTTRVTRNAAGVTAAWELFYALTNDSGSPIHALRLGAEHSAEWVAGLGRPVTVALSGEVGATLRGNRNRLDPGQQIAVSVIVSTALASHEAPIELGEAPQPQTPPFKAVLRAIEPLESVHVSLRMEWHDGAGQRWSRRVMDEAERVTNAT